MNPWISFCQNLTQNLIQAASLHQKWIEENGIISWVWSFFSESFVIWSLFHSIKLFSSPAKIFSDLIVTFFPHLQFHFALVCSLSLEGNPWCSPCPGTSLICRRFLSNAIFLLLLWTVLLLDSLIAAISIYVTDQKWWEEKNAKRERSKIPRSFVWQRFKASYLISHNLPSVTNMFHYNLHLNGVKWRLFSWLPTPPPCHESILSLHFHLMLLVQKPRETFNTPLLVALL